jgi:periplasmic protein TonB
MKIILPFFLLLISVSAKAQENETVYIFDANWKPAKIKKGRFMLHRRNISDTCWQWDFYNFLGPLIKTEQYRDKEGTIRDGEARYYNDKGIIDSVTHYRRGRKNGDSWKLSGDSMKFKFKYVFLDDSLIEVVDLTKAGTDTSISYKDEQESEYPGGIIAWYKFLGETMQYPTRAQNEKIEGTVQVGFIIDIYGNAIDPYIAKSVEFSLDEESIRIIKASGTWLAAIQNGNTVKSYKLQPLIFKLTGNY